MGPYRFLCALMDCNRTLSVLINQYAFFWSIKVFIGSIAFLCIFVGIYSAICVIMGIYGF